MSWLNELKVDDIVVIRNNKMNIDQAARVVGIDDKIHVDDDHVLMYIMDSFDANTGIGIDEYYLVPYTKEHEIKNRIAWLCHAITDGLCEFSNSIYDNPDTLGILENIYSSMEPIMEESTRLYFADEMKRISYEVPNRI
jgi:hypothetical protein